MDVAGRRVTLMGLGCHGGGLGAAQFLAAQRAHVTVTDLADASRLTCALDGLRDVPIARYRLGEHVAEDFCNADMVVVNAAVQPDHPLIDLARRSGAAITSEIELFLERCRAPIIGVTGSNGKSTEASMIAAMLAADGRRTFLGGNIGVSLLGELDAIDQQAWVVLELSSFQLAHLGGNVRLPEIAVVTNCTPNHLHWHGTLARYVAAKQRLVRGQPPSGIAVLNMADRSLGHWAEIARGRVVAPWPDDWVPPLAVAGRHNRINAACAMAAAAAAGCSERAMTAALTTFRGLPHRLEFVAEIADRRFFNDSKATTPEASLAAMAACPAPTWLLAGGDDKGVDFGPWAQAVAPRARGVALFGSARQMLLERLRAVDPGAEIMSTECLDDALAWCWHRSSPGETILLSPACASFDQFDDYAQRGRRFVELVRQLRPWSANVEQEVAR